MQSTSAIIADLDSGAAWLSYARRVGADVAGMLAAERLQSAERVAVKECPQMVPVLRNLQHALTRYQCPRALDVAEIERLMSTMTAA
jgi:hypothetical protein